MTVRDFFFIKVGQFASTRVFGVTILRSIAITVVATEHLGTHVTLGVRCLWLEFSVGFALWNNPFAEG